MSKWTKTNGEAPDLSGTEMGDLVEKLKALSLHYETQLQGEFQKLDTLNNLKAKYELQKRSRKVDPNA